MRHWWQFAGSQWLADLGRPCEIFLLKKGTLATRSDGHVKQLVHSWGDTQCSLLKQSG